MTVFKSGSGAPGASARAFPAKAARAKIATGVLLGWLLYDLAVLGSGPEPGGALELLPGSAVALLIGAAFAWGWALQARLFWVLAGVTAVGSAIPLLPGLLISQALVSLSRTVLIMLLAAGVLWWAASRWRLPSFWTGLASGTVAATGRFASLGGVKPLGLVLLGAAAVGLCSVRFRATWIRRIAVVVALTGPAIFVVATGYRQVRLSRPDQPVAVGTQEQGRPNLLMIVLDTVGAHHLAPYGYERVTTPGLDAFVREHAVLYEWAWSTSSWTLPSHASLFTGLYPAEHHATHPRVGEDRRTIKTSVRPAQRMRDDIPTLAERFSAIGYRTGAIVGNSLFVTHDFGLDRGFGRYDDRSGTWLGDYLTLVQLAGLTKWKGYPGYRRAETITDLALRWLDEAERDTPFFLFVNYMDAHWVYLPVPPFDRAFSEERALDDLHPRGALRSLLYDRELLYLDHHLNRFLQEVEGRGLYDNTLIIITSDHGEAFREHGFWGHGHTLYEEVLRVPLYVKPVGPRVEARSSRPMTGVDVYLLALSGLGLQQRRPSRAPGLLAELYRSPEQAASFRRLGLDIDRDLVAWLDGTVKLIASSRGEVEAYDLAEDGLERRPLALNGEQVDRALARAREWWAAHPPSLDERPREIDTETRERLRGLGYLD